MKKLPLLEAGKDNPEAVEAIRVANSMGYNFSLGGRRGGSYFYSIKPNVPGVTSMELKLYKVARAYWKITIMPTFTEHEAIARKADSLDLVWFNIDDKFDDSK